MDSMDWFNPEEDAAAKQAQALNRALKMGGRVLLRSASIDPWYIKDFEANGFTPRRVGARFPGTCIDRLVFTHPYLSVILTSRTASTCTHLHGSSPKHPMSMATPDLAASSASDRAVLRWRLSPFNFHCHSVFFLWNI